jgi:hypothetical protein
MEPQIRLDQTARTIGHPCEAVLIAFAASHTAAILDGLPEPKHPEARAAASRMRQIAAERHAEAEMLLTAGPSVDTVA